MQSFYLIYLVQQEHFNDCGQALEYRYGTDEAKKLEEIESIVKSSAEDNEALYSLARSYFLTADGIDPFAKTIFNDVSAFESQLSL